MSLTKVGGERLQRVSASGMYIGNGSSQNFNIGFQPKEVEIIDVTGTVYRSIKLDTMPGSDFMRTKLIGFGGSNPVFYVTSGQGITITSTGFSVGNEASINENGNTYRWIARI